MRVKVKAKTGGFWSIKKYWPETETEAEVTAEEFEELRKEVYLIAVALEEEAEAKESHAKKGSK